MGVSIRAYAQHRGVSHEAVRKAVATGRIQKDPDGSIDPAKADAQWVQHTRQAQPPAPASPSSRRPVATTVSQALGASSGAADETRGVDYHKARAVRETYAARLAKLEFEERSGKLVSADELKVALFGHYRRLRDALLQIPAKIAPDIVALAAGGALTMRDVEDAIYTELHETLDEFANPPIA